MNVLEYKVHAEILFFEVTPHSFLKMVAAPLQTLLAYSPLMLFGAKCAEAILSIGKIQG